MPTSMRPHYGNSNPYGTYAVVIGKTDFGIDLSKSEGRLAVAGGLGRTMAEEIENGRVIDKIHGFGAEAEFGGKLSAMESQLTKAKAATVEQLGANQEQVKSWPSELQYAFGAKIGVQAGVPVHLAEKTVSDQLEVGGANTSKQDEQLLKQKTKEVDKEAEKLLEERNAQVKDFRKEMGIPEIVDNTKRLTAVADKIEQRVQAAQKPAAVTGGESQKWESGTYAPSSHQPEDGGDIGLSS